MSVNKDLTVNINDLFRWKGELEITDKDGNVIETLYLRVIGDAEVQNARIYALKESRLLRKKLNDTNSDEHLALIPFKGEKNKAELISMITFSRYQQFRDEAEMSVTERYVKPPKDNDPLEKHEQYVEDVEEAKKEYEAAVQNKVVELSEKFINTLQDKTDDELYELYVKEVIDILCRNVMVEAFDEYSAFSGTYKDAKFKQRRFLSIDEFKNLSPYVKQRIITEYKKLELSLAEIKK